MNEKIEMQKTRLESSKAYSVPKAGKTVHSHTGHPGADSGFFILGNQAVQKLFKSELMMQAKLKIGQPNDFYEQEADKVAERVMRMPDTAIRGRQSTISKVNESVQKKPG